MLPTQSDPVIWRGPRKDGFIKECLTKVHWGPLDFLIIDAPPGTSDEHITLAQTLQMSTNGDGAIIVATPQEVALLAVRKGINFCRKVGIPILGIIENMSSFVCSHCLKETDIYGTSHGLVANISNEMKIPYLGAIPLSKDLRDACDRGRYYVQPACPVSQAFDDLVKKITVLSKSAEKD